MSSRRDRVVLGFGAAVLAVALVTVASPASAFCRITTCDPSEQTCTRDEETGCLVVGKPLYWASSCVTIATQRDGSIFHGIPAEEVEALAVEALGRWLDVECGGGNRPSLSVESIGQVVCDRAEYNGSGNANILMIRDRDWPYSGRANTLGKTHLVFEPDGGRIYDADIEVNGSQGDISIGDPVVGADLLSILMHEFGHFLGLDHSLDESATMFADYQPYGTEFRTLAQDDIDGICAIYPPEREATSSSCTPRHGFSAECGGNSAPRESPRPPPSGGCELSGGQRGRGGGSEMLLFVLAFAVLRYRRPRCVS